MSWLNPKTGNVHFTVKFNDVVKTTKNKKMRAIDNVTGETIVRELWAIKTPMKDAKGAWMYVPDYWFKPAAYEKTLANANPDYTLILKPGREYAIYHEVQKEDLTLVTLTAEQLMEWFESKENELAYNRERSMNINKKFNALTGEKRNIDQKEAKEQNVLNTNTATAK